MNAKPTVDSILAALTQAKDAGTLTWDMEGALLRKLTATQLTELIERINASGRVRQLARSGSKSDRVMNARFWRSLVFGRQHGIFSAEAQANR